MSRGRSRRRSTPALPVEVVLVANTLLHESATASMLVLGTRRLSTLTGLLVGSTSVAVAGHADCLVVIVRGPDPDEAPRETGAGGGRCGRHDRQ